MRRWADRANDELRGAGYRMGPARSAVIDFLAGQDCCLGAQEIHQRLGGRAGLASVYRILETLAERGLVQRVDVGDGIARYEVHGDEHHHHLICDDCGKVEAFEDERLEAAIREVEARSGYAIAAHDVVLRGACTACRN
ncbi:MAG TPA: Fur family transcriptional regulator [Gaiellaceae bacterium]